MFNVKKKLVKDYRNIIILALLLAIFFSLGNMIFERKALAASQTLQQDKQEDLLYKAIHHVFPAGGIQSGKGALDGLKSLYTSAIGNLFFVDLRNPYTFISSQFPVMNRYKETLAMNIDLDEKGGGNEPEKSTAPSFSFVVDEEGKVTMGTNIQEGTPIDPNNQDLDRDDSAELDSGVYTPGTDIVDSRNPGEKLTLENVKLPEKINFEEGKPHILIYHTHGTEAYKPAVEGNYRTLKKEYSVMAAAEIIKKELEKQGFNVIHDTTYHDYPSYAGSYTRSLATAREILKNNPSIKVVIDLHRDGYEYPNNENMIRNSQWTYNNETFAKYFVVVGPESPNRKKVETFGQFLKAVSDEKYPGLSKPVLVKPYGKFNQFLVDHYALVELGSNANTIEEAKRSAYRFAEVFGEALKHISK